MGALDQECRRAGLDPAKISRLANRLGRAAKDAHSLGLTIFGGSGAGSLRWSDPYETDARAAPFVVAHIPGFNFDGGDGAEAPDENGLMRGEHG